MRTVIAIKNILRVFADQGIRPIDFGELVSVANYLGEEKTNSLYDEVVEEKYNELKEFYGEFLKHVNDLFRGKFISCMNITEEAKRFCYRNVESRWPYDIRTYIEFIINQWCKDNIVIKEGWQDNEKGGAQ